MCSFPNSTLAKPTLLDLSDVQTLFHELGHCMHNLVSHTKYAVPHSRDYIEIPSVLLEYWAWEPEILTRIGRHYTCLDSSTTSTEDGAIPKSLLESVQANRGCFGASAMLPVLQRAIFDLEIHSPQSHREAVDMDITALWNTSRRDLVGQSGNMEDWGWEQAAFGHIFRKYSAGFFAYAM